MIINGYSPDTLIIAVAVAAVVIAILYLIRVRRRAIAVPYIGLWREVMEQKKRRRYSDWLKRLISYLICMMVVGLIALALLDPRNEEDDSARRHAIVVLDTSASMAADSGRDDCTSRFDCAKRDASELLDRMKMTDRAVIIEASGIVSAVSGPFQSDKNALQKTLKTMSIRAASADMKKALELASHLANGRENPEIYLFTDGQFEAAESLSELIPPTAAFEQTTYGAPSGNLAIEAFNVRRYIANRLGFEVFFKAHNGFDKPVTAKLKIVALADDEPLFDGEREHDVIVEKSLTLASGSSELRLYENLTLGSSRMAATIDIVDPADLVDPMPMDNIAYARIPDYAKPDIACITPGNLYLEAALLLNENYRVSFVKPTDPSVLNAEGSLDLAKVSAGHDIVILDNSYRNLPHLAQDEWKGRAIFINPDASDAPFKARTVQNPVIERVNSKHGVARWLALKNLNIARASVFSGVKNDALVMRAIEGPVMATKNGDGQRLLAIGFSLVESDLIFRVGLPVLFINAIDWLMDENAEPLRGYAAGRAWHVSVPGDVERVDIIRPDHEQIRNLPVYDKSVAIYGEQAGFYQVKSASDGTGIFEFAANFADAQESDLSRPVAELKGRLAPTLSDEENEMNEEDSWLDKILSKLPDSTQYVWVLALLIALGILTAEWLTYHRRWTV